MQWVKFEFGTFSPAWPKRITGGSILLIVFACMPVLAKDIRVCPGEQYQDIQAALNEAEPGDTVLVCAGEYVVDEPIDFNPGEIAGPDETRNIILRSVDGPEETIIRMSDPPKDEERGTLIIFDSGETTDSVVDGFTLVGGHHTLWGENPGDVGGGGVLCIYGSSPTIRNCVFRDNISDRGPGVYYAGLSSPVVEGCIFEHNLANWWGGAIYGRDESVATIHGCVFRENVSIGNGGGIYLWDGANPTITDCLFENNVAESGGAISSQIFTAPTIINCAMIRNRAQYHGGAINTWGGTPVIERCTMAGNSSAWGGGVQQSERTIEIDGEPQTFGGVTIEGSLIWGNSGKALWWKPGEKPIEVSHSCVEMPAGQLAELGEGNISQDPLFGAWGPEGEVWVDAGAAAGGDGTEASPFVDLASALSTFDYRLAVNSPCIDAGTGGGDMGATGGWVSERCDAPGRTGRIIHLAPGTYRIRGHNLSHEVSLLGSGRTGTIVEGTLCGLRTGTVVSDLTVTRGMLGGIRIGDSEDCELTNLIITGNAIRNHPASPSKFGGGVDCHGSSAILTNCWIIGNWAADGGGFHCWGSSPIVRNCVIAGNRALRGGGINLYQSTTEFYNCTIALNVVDGDTELVRDAISVTALDDPVPGASSKSSFVNCIIEGSSREQIEEIVDLEYCILDDELQGVMPFQDAGAFDFDALVEVPCELRTVHLPDFIEQWPDFQLAPGSVPIDRGTADGTPLLDCVGSPRCDDPSVSNKDDEGADLYFDVGAYEFTEHCVSLSLSSPRCIEDGKVEVDVLLTNWSPVSGFAFGVAHDPGMARLESAHWEACAAYEGIEFLDDMSVDLEAEPSGCDPEVAAGCVVRCSVDIGGEVSIGNGVDQSILRLVYEPVSGCDASGSPLRIVSCLADSRGVAEASVTIEGQSYFPSLSAGELACCSSGAGPWFLRGDTDDSGEANLTDAVVTLRYLFMGGEPPSCLEAADSNDDDELNLTDAVHLLGYLFLGGPAPPAPGPDICGPDPADSPGGLGCESYRSCIADDQALN